MYGDQPSSNAEPASNSVITDWLQSLPNIQQSVSLGINSTQPGRKRPPDGPATANNKGQYGHRSTKRSRTITKPTHSSRPNQQRLTPLVESTAANRCKKIPMPPRDRFAATAPTRSSARIRSVQQQRGSGEEKAGEQQTQPRRKHQQQQQEQQEEKEEEEQQEQNDDNDDDEEDKEEEEEAVQSANQIQSLQGQTVDNRQRTAPPMRSAPLVQFAASATQLTTTQTQTLGSQAPTTSSSKTSIRTSSVRRKSYSARGQKYAADPLFEFKRFEDKTYPSLLEPLLKRIKQISRAVSVVAATPGDFDDVDDSILDDERFYERVPSENGLGDPTGRQVQKIVALSRACAPHAEAEWNIKVHSKVLKTALKCSNLDRKVDWHYIPTTQLASDTLPTNVDKKQVDFVIVQKETAIRHEQLRACGIDCCNPILADALSHSPITVSIETKLSGEGRRAAQTQLATWGAALFAHLRLLFEDVPPFLPLLLVQGDQWFFWAASQDDSVPESSRIGLPRTFVWEEILIGSTNKPSGVFQVVKVVQELLSWSATVQKEWYDNQLDKLLRICGRVI